MRNEFEIKLNDLRFYSFIGLFPQEQAVGNNFIVNVSVKYNADDFFKDEDINSTISYADIFEIVKEEMGEKSLLLESVEKKIFNAVFARWNYINSFRISIIKEKPPIESIDGNAEVTFYFEKN